MNNVIDISRRLAARETETRETTGAITLFIHIKNATLIAHYTGRASEAYQAEQLQTT